MFGIRYREIEIDVLYTQHERGKKSFKNDNNMHKYINIRFYFSGFLLYEIGTDFFRGHSRNIQMDEY